MSGMII